MLMILARLVRSESFWAVVKVRSPHTGPEVSYPRRDLHHLLDYATKRDDAASRGDAAPSDDAASAAAGQQQQQQQQQQKATTPFYANWTKRLRS